MPGASLRFLVIEGGAVRTEGVTRSGKTMSDAVRTALFEATGDHRRVALTAGRKADYSIPYRIGAIPSLSKILEEVTADGWQPTCVLMVRPEYAAIPEGLFESELPVAAYVSDWNFALSRIVKHLRLYDAVLTDSVGVSVLGGRGLQNLREFRLYSAPSFYDHDSAGVSRRPIDLLFPANLGRTIHMKRARWVQRLAALAEQGVKVKLLTGVTGEEAARWMARSKMVFNHSARSEFSTRCFEALASGCVLVCERGNVELAARMSPGLEYLDYGDDDFEAVVLKALSEPDRLEDIAGRAQEHFRSAESNEVRGGELGAILGELRRRPPRRLSSADRAAIYDQQLWCEGGRVFPVGFPPNPDVADALAGLGPGQEELAHALANALALLHLSVRETFRDRRSPLDEATMAQLHRLVSALYELASAQGWLVPRIGALVFAFHSGDSSAVVDGVPGLLEEVDRCDDPLRLEGHLLSSAIGYAPELMEREQVLATFGRVVASEYLGALRAITAGLLHLLLGDAKAQKGDARGAAASYASAGACLPASVISPGTKLSGLAFARCREATERGDRPEAGVWADLCISAARPVLAESVLSVEQTMLECFSCLVFRGRHEEARKLYEDYRRATDCIVGGGGFRDPIDAALEAMERLLVNLARGP